MARSMQRPTSAIASRPIKIVRHTDHHMPPTHTARALHPQKAHSPTYIVYTLAHRPSVAHPFLARPARVRCGCGRPLWRWCPCSEPVGPREPCHFVVTEEPGPPTAGRHTPHTKTKGGAECVGGQDARRAAWLRVRSPSLLFSLLRPHQQHRRLYRRVPVHPVPAWHPQRLCVPPNPNELSAFGGCPFIQPPAHGRCAGHGRCRATRDAHGTCGCVGFGSVVVVRPRTRCSWGWHASS